MIGDTRFDFVPAHPAVPLPFTKEEARAAFKAIGWEPLKGNYAIDKGAGYWIKGSLPQCGCLLTVVAVHRLGLGVFLASELAPKKFVGLAFPGLSWEQERAIISGWDGVKFPIAVADIKPEYFPSYLFAAQLAEEFKPKSWAQLRDEHFAALAAAEPEYGP